MVRMQCLRNAHAIIRFVLVWFALSIGIGIASPIVQPRATQLICTGSGVTRVPVETGDGSQEVIRHTMDCPLCVPVSAPPPVAHLAAGPVRPLAYVLPVILAEHLASFTAAPPPGCGPPAFF